jgi:predicted metal-dependent peptidase
MSGQTQLETSETEQTASALASLELTPKQVSQWGDTNSMMAWTCPGFRHIWYKMLNNNAGKHVAIMSREVPIAATDGNNMILNPDTFFEFALPNRVFIAAHEICHNVFDDVRLLHRCQSSGKVPMHDGSDLPFDNDTMQKAMDLRINALLKSSKIGKPPSVGHFDDTMDGTESVLDVYGKVYKKKKEDDEGGGSNPGKGEGNTGNNPGGFDNLQAPGQSTGQSPSQAMSQRNPQQWAVAVAAAQTIEQIRSQGKMAAALKRMFQDILEPEVPWVDHIETIIRRTTGSGSRDWKSPDEWFIGRDIYQPRKTGKGAGWIVVWGDTSGSRNDAELTSNMAELAGILDDVHPARLTVIWCDAAIDYIDEIEDPADLAHIRSRGTAGGGGTSVDPVMKWIDDNAETPDLFIGFTDGYVSFPGREPRFPVIWASSTDTAYPWGQVVRVNKVVRP